uniref:Ovule protein n=1 Tax=Haemonchus placei TaxID=6290 RepID=A0A0N4X2Y0_HAEPC
LEHLMRKIIQSCTIKHKIRHIDSNVQTNMGYMEGAQHRINQPTPFLNLVIAERSNSHGWRSRATYHPPPHVEERRDRVF